MEELKNITFEALSNKGIEAVKSYQSTGLADTIPVKFENGKIALPFVRTKRGNYMLRLTNNGSMMNIPLQNKFQPVEGSIDSVDVEIFTYKVEEDYAIPNSDRVISAGTVISRAWAGKEPFNKDEYGDRNRY